MWLKIVIKIYIGVKLFDLPSDMKRARKKHVNSILFTLNAFYVFIMPLILLNAYNFILQKSVLDTNLIFPFARIQINAINMKSYQVAINANINHIIRLRM